jgi:hypothetical protein
VSEAAEPLGAIAELRAEVAARRARMKLHVVWTRGLPPLDAAMAD